MLDWTENCVATLCESVAAGHSSGRAAEILTRQTGERVTRNATISKAGRLGLRFNSVSGGTAKKPGPRRRYRKRSAHSQQTLDQYAGERLPPVAFTPDPKSIDADAIPVEQRISLLELTNDTCRFPYGLPGTDSFFFCGALGADNAKHMPYCLTHSRIAYSRPQQSAKAAA